MGVSDYAVIMIMTSILCLCLPSVPSSSIITIIVVLNSINLSYLNISMLYTAEWILDRMRTTVNVYSHCICSVISANFCKDDFYDAEPFEIKDEDFEDPSKFGIKLESYDNVNSTPKIDYNTAGEESDRRNNHYAQLKSVVGQNQSFNDVEI